MPLILFVLSFVVLSLEVLETKIFAYSLANNLIFLVIGVVLLGFGAGGTWLSLKPKLEDPRPLVRRNLFLCAVLLVIAHAWFALFADRVNFDINLAAIWEAGYSAAAFDAAVPLLWTLSVLVLLAAPYFYAGMAISAILAEKDAKVQTRYGINLLGSALGCASIFFILGPLTGPECLMACAGVLALMGVGLCQQKFTALVATVALGVPCFLYADAILPYPVQQAPGQLALIENKAKAIVAANDQVQRLELKSEFDRWDPTARVEVHGLDYETSNPAFQAQQERLPTRFFTQDSSYGSPLVAATEAAKGLYTRTAYGVGYFRNKARPEVCVIGLGGAPDVQTALHHDPAHVDGVDINKTTIEMVRGPMAEFLGKPYQDPRFTAHVRDGRSFVRMTERRYDLIQLSGVDTKTVLASGTLALNESYLYTREAFRDYISRLKDDGILCIIYAGDKLRDRFAVTALRTLEEDFGASTAHKHLMMVEQSAMFCFLVKRSPFTAEECQQMDAWLAQADTGDGTTGVQVTVIEMLTEHLSLNNAPKALFIPDGRETEVEVMVAARQGSEALATFIAERRKQEPQAGYKDADGGWVPEVVAEVLEPAPDSKPFFFNITANEQVLDELWAGNAATQSFREMFQLLLMMLGLSVLLIAGPLVVFGARHAHDGEEIRPHGKVGLGEQIAEPFLLAWRGGYEAVRNIPFAIYFACLGAGFVMAMSGLIQRYTLYLGHQGFAFPTVIGGLLVAAGIGSLLSAKARRPAKVMVTATIVICAALAGLQFGLPLLFEQTAGLELIPRVCIALAILLPLGVPMGMMFPTGLAVVKQRSPLFVPWAFGINGVFSVIGSTVVLPGSLLFGFPTMAYSAAGIYVLAALMGWLTSRNTQIGAGGELPEKLYEGGRAKRAKAQTA